MAYLVLARKYRPQTFEDVIRQDHVTLTLKNAIASNRMAHAVLFSGPRGTGKTTVARILAKSMNCENGPAPTPCNTCKSCHDITYSGSVDVYEIDGASNNGVEQVRELRDNIKYMPAHSRYKIYIIDEVHMLSTAAFNALLKTLEEPPAHVMFIFATTEPHKIPLTILSRCRRHDFRRIPVEYIATHLETICKKENFDIDAHSLHLMAREAGGCMRDALSLLDQVMTCSTGGLSYDQVVDIMGIIDRKMIFDLTTGILTGDVPDILETLDDIYNRGQDIKKLYGDLLEHFRDLMVVKLGKKVDRLVDVPAHELKMMSEQVVDISASYLEQLFDILFKEEPTIRFSVQPKLSLEMALIRMCRIKPALSIDELIEKLDQFKSAINAKATNTSFSEAIINYHKNKNKVPQSRIAEETILKDKCLDEQGIALCDDYIENSDVEIVNKLNEKIFDWKQPPDIIWEKIVKKISETYGFLGAMLSKAKLVSLEKDCIKIESNDNGIQFNRIKKNIDKIKEICMALTGNGPEIVIEANENAQANFQDRINSEKRLKQEAMDHPMVARIIEIFDGKVMDVKVLKEDQS